MNKLNWPDCIVEMPHIVADPCHPRWVVKCEHGYWFYHQTALWTDKRDEMGAYITLNGLWGKVLDHANAFCRR